MAEFWLKVLRNMLFEQLSTMNFIHDIYLILTFQKQQ